MIVRSPPLPSFFYEKITLSISPLQVFRLVNLYFYPSGGAIDIKRVIFGGGCVWSHLYLAIRSRSLQYLLPSSSCTDEQPSGGLAPVCLGFFFCVPFYQRTVSCISNLNSATSTAFSYRQCLRNRLPYLTTIIIEF